MIMVALCITENDHYILRRVFVLQTLFLRRLRTDFLETWPHDVGSSSTETVHLHLLRWS